MDHTTSDTQLFAELYDVQPQAIVWMRPVWSPGDQFIEDFEFTYANDEGLKYLNLNRDQFTGLNISSSPTLNDEQRKIFLEELIRVYQTGYKSETEIFNPVLNKYARVLRMRLRDGVLNVVQDITKENLVIQKLEEQTAKLEKQAHQLQEQTSLLDSILQNSSNGISVSEVFRNSVGKVTDAVTIMANDAAVKHIGLPRELYLTKRATELEPGIIDSPYYQACIRTLETGEPFTTQYRLHANGRWLEVTVSRLDHNHLIQVFSDITATKEAQLEMEKAASTLKAVFDAAQAGMFTFTPVFNSEGNIIDFRFVIANATFSAYVDQKPAALEGELGSKWFPGYLTNGVFDMYKHTYETGESQRQDIHYHVDGLDIYLDLQSVKMGEQVLVSFADYTFVRKTQLQLEQAVKALQRSNAYLQDFAYAASHDLKEPIRKILAFTGRLKATLLPRIDERETIFLDRIEMSALRMQRLVDDLLEFTQVSEQPREKENVNLNDIIERVLADLELSIEEKQAEVILTGKLPVVQGNRRQMQQLFQNLVSNSLKYSKPELPPAITINSALVKTGHPALENVSALEGQSLYLLEVTDNGIGFEQKYAAQIFEMLKRLHGITEYSGTGVGLSIARKVVENHQGHIWAESEPGKGSVFRILLPVNPVSATQHSKTGNGG